MATSIIAPKSEVVLIEALGEVTAILPVKEAVVVEVGQQGPAGPSFPAGNEGDIIRYNAATGDWESCSEPFEFQGIVLVPMTLPGGVVAEGFVGYRAVDKSIYVQID